MIKRTASARWEGDLKAGTGHLALGSGAWQGPYSFGTRFESARGTNPEELIGAALAGCFTMALSASLARAGTPVRKVETTATVHLEKTGDATSSLTVIELTTRGEVPGLAEAAFKAAAEDARKNCIISRALGGVDIRVQATLAG